MSEAEVKKPGRFRRWFVGGLGLALGVILPAVTLAVELATGMCADFGINPIPTHFHVALVASVPAGNLLLLLWLRQGRPAGHWALHLLAGFVMAVSLAYAAFLLPAVLFGALVCVLMFWYFGAGFIGLLPQAPVFSAVTAWALHVALRNRAKEAGATRVRGFGWGILLAAGVGAALALRPLALNYAVCQALDGDAAVSARGVRILRAVADDRDLCHLVRGARYGRSRGPRYGRSLGPLWGLHELDWVPDHTQLNVDAAKRLCYRVTGEHPDAFDSWSGSRRRRWRWDSIMGGDKVGQELEGLSLKDSAYETKVSAQSGLAYAEWTLVFANALEWRDQEARCRIDLPKGAVVSRATLWIGGEEREAAFGTKGQVRQAYESVVRRNRDPLLVTTSGPDQVQVQCFPVPRNGEMKIRLGITLPLDLADDAKSARVPVPVLSDRNFAVPRDMLGLPTARTVALDESFGPVAAYVDGETAIVRRLTRADPVLAQKAVVVLDGSAAMKDFLPRLGDVLAGVPQTTELTLWIADDDGAEVRPVVSPAGDSARAETVRRALAGVACAGGCDNVRPLVKAADALAQAGGAATLFWVHGPDPVAFPGAEALAAKLAQLTSVRVYLCPLRTGTSTLADVLRPSERLVSCSTLAVADDPVAAFGELLARLARPGWKTTYEKVAPDAVPAEAVSADRHLGRLWAAAETTRTYRVGDPVSLKAAQDLALPWQIVTPVTGAVVLETAEQYKDNGLEPAEASSVPTVPEPEEWLVFLLVLLVLAGVLMFRLRRAWRMTP